MYLSTLNTCFDISYTTDNWIVWVHSFVYTWYPNSTEALCSFNTNLNKRDIKLHFVHNPVSNVLLMPLYYKIFDCLKQIAIDVDLNTSRIIVLRWVGTFEQKVFIYVFSFI